jgi:septal ring factor EnvC (AmiA/AmiB activator)
MRRIALIQGFLLSALLVAPAVVTLGADTEDDSVESQRQALSLKESELRNLERDLDTRRRSRDALAAELEARERDIAQLAHGGRQLDVLIKEQVKALTRLQKDLEAERAALERERRSLAALLRSFHTLGNNEQLRLLLDQQDMARQGRLLSYYGYLNRYRLGRLDNFAARTANFEKLRAETVEETQRLAVLAARQKETQERLARAQAQRADLLVELDKGIEGGTEQLALVREDTRNLRALVEQLERQAMILPEAELALISIASRRGQLTWPLAEGRMLTRFGQVRTQGGQALDGVLIAAREGSEVRAVHPGRVVFADWLRGFGQLIIIDHDEGYLTLYGHNQALLKETGEWVGDGEVIALSGASGGQRSAALYFAIRYKSQPQDPEHWCGAALAVANS